MTDWSFPALTQTWANFRAALKGRDESNAKMDYSADTNIPDGTIKWSSTNNRFELWNATTSTWGELSTLYSINVDKVDSENAADFASAVGGTGSRQAKDAATCNGVSLPNAIASVLNDHTKATHDALNIDAATLGSLTSAQFLRSDTSDSMSGSLTLTGATRPAAGSVGAPAHSFSSDTNSGMYRAADGDIRIASNGVWRFRVVGATVQVNDGSTRNVWHDGNVTDVWRDSNTAGRVDQSKLKTALDTETLSANFAVGVESVRTLAAGQYGFFAQHGGDETAGGNGGGFYLPGSFGDTNPPDPASYPLSDATTATLRVDESASGETSTTRVLMRYIQASPPYNLGNGDIPLFVWADMAPDGTIRGLSIAADPPWAYNGPTKITPHVSKNGKLYRYIKTPSISLRDVIQKKASMAEYTAAKALADSELVEITQAMKQADMPLFPNPWPSVPATGQIVLLDPVSDLTLNLLELQEEGERVDLLVEKYLVISNEVSGAIAPPRTAAVKARWKNTR